MRRIILALAFAISLPLTSWAYCEFASGSCSNGNSWWEVTTYNNSGQVTSITECDCNGVISTDSYSAGKETGTTLIGNVPYATSTTFNPGPQDSWVVSGFDLSNQVYTVTCDTLGSVTIQTNGAIIAPNGTGSMKQNVPGSQNSTRGNSIGELEAGYSNGFLSVSLDGVANAEATLQLYDVLGRMVMMYGNFPIKSGNNEFRLSVPSTCSAGTYFLRAVVNSSVQTRELIVSR